MKGRDFLSSGLSREFLLSGQSIHCIQKCLNLGGDFSSGFPPQAVGQVRIIRATENTFLIDRIPAALAFTGTHRFLIAALCSIAIHGSAITFGSVAVLGGVIAFGSVAVLGGAITFGSVAVLGGAIAFGSVAVLGGVIAFSSVAIFGGVITLGSAAILGDAIIFDNVAFFDAGAGIRSIISASGFLLHRESGDLHEAQAHRQREEKCKYTLAEIIRFAHLLLPFFAHFGRKESGGRAGMARFPYFFAL